MSRAKVTAEFDRLARQYETNRLSGWYKGLNRLALDKIQGRSFRTALDIGCATGWLLREAVRDGLVSRGLGIDTSPEMVRVAREMSSDWKTLQFECDWWPTNDYTLLKSLRGADIDLVLCASAAHYFTDIREAFKQIYDVMQPGGTLIVLERAPDLSLATRTLGWLHTGWWRDGARFHNTSKITATLRDIGFYLTSEPLPFRKLLWSGKLFTSIALTECRKPHSNPLKYDDCEADNESSPFRSPA